MSYTSPDAVRRPWKGSPYQEAMPVSDQPSSTAGSGVTSGSAARPAHPATAKERKRKSDATRVARRGRDAAGPAGPRAT